MSDEQPPPPKASNPPSPQDLIARAKRLKSQALCVSTTRLIQESRHLREANERAMKEAEKENARKPAPRKKPKNGSEK